jgi:hypothetical protein
MLEPKDVFAAILQKVFNCLLHMEFVGYSSVEIGRVCLHKVLTDCRKMLFLLQIFYLVEVNAKIVIVVMFGV